MVNSSVLFGGSSGLDTCLDEVPSSQKRPVAKPLREYEENTANRNAAIMKAYQSGGYSMKAIADYYGLHYSTVSRVVKQYESSEFKT